jgi:hypothetical protein
MQINYSLYKINNSEAFDFSAFEYSCFKYGDDKIAEKFGNALANGFISNFLAKRNVTKQIVVISSPYSFIPTATFAMKNYFVFTINRWLSENNLPVVQETKVHRTITYKEDYGELSAADRMKLIGNDSFHIDSNFLIDKILVFLDDIKITGSHERMITKMLSDNNIRNDTYLLYFAELVNFDINPNIENYLNYFAVKSIFDLDKIINSERFSINTRIVKFILNSSKSTFQSFIKDQSMEFKNRLYDMAIGNGYHTLDVYALNLKQLKEKLINKNKLEVVFFK